MVYADIDRRVVEIAEYIVERRDTVRGAAQHFGCSKSTIHKYMTERLQTLDGELYLQVRGILDLNKAERHIRGGLATRNKYKNSHS
ncbi:MAG: sporulation transcriptional regulator SpoIIID [Oscillospiraceae bacterium]|nr:sporulation transcriptional regulator SpoIIID [Oscillospiraceae bacterium]